MADEVDKTIKPLELWEIRSALMRQEETIIFALVERSQFKRNPNVYEPGLLTSGSKDSFLDFFLAESEKVHSLVRRYTSPDENPFFPDRILHPVLPPMSYPAAVIPNSINFNSRIMATYLKRILPLIAIDGDDGNYGSSATCDMAALQAISKRVHYGKFVAEAKYQASTEEYRKLINAKDSNALLALLTNVAVEEKLLQRVRQKARTYGRDLDETGGPEEEEKMRVDPEVIVELYRDCLIPLTKQVQVHYLLQRLSPPRVGYLGPPGSFSHQASMQYFRQLNPEAVMVPQDTVASVFQRVMSNEASFGLIPFENSIGGKVQGVIGHLTSSGHRPSICGDCFLKVSQCLISHPSVGDYKHIKRVYSHPQALLQCQQWLREHMPQVEQVPTTSTSGAAEMVKGMDDTCAAIGSSLLANQYELRVLQQDMQDQSFNRTRFLVLRRDPLDTLNVSSGKDRTILILSLRNQVGSLARALAVFAEHKVNLTTLESVKNPAEAWAYDFFVEIEGHRSDPPVSAALDSLKGESHSVVILGSFPTAADPVQ